MAVLNKNWGSAKQVSPTEAAVVTGVSSEEADEVVEPKLAAKPILVYVPAEDSGEFDKAEKVVLMSDDVCIGMWAFDTIKMLDADAKADPLLAKGTETPRFYVIHRDYSKVKLIESKDMSAKKLFGAMEAAADAAYKQKLGKTTKSVLKILLEYDKIANERRVLEEKRTREGAADKKMESDLAEIDAREKAAKEEHENLLKFDLK